jgi:hypothetical protein
VNYDNEKVYSFFIVDEDDDTISVETDDTLYQAGDEIMVFGQVDDVVEDEEDVQITIIDPNNVKILDEENVTLGGGGVDDDEFEFTFDDLDSDADHGRYAIIVSYDNGDQQGFTLFEVEDPDAGGSDNISAEMSDDTYAPGDTVSLSGTIYDTHSSTDLEIVIRDPGNHVVSAYSDNNVAVTTNGDFDYHFGLNDDAVEGKYTVTITYGSDDLKLDFTVDAGISGFFDIKEKGTASYNDHNYKVVLSLSGTYTLVNHKVVFGQVHGFVTIGHKIHAPLKDIHFKMSKNHKTITISAKIDDPLIDIAGIKTSVNAIMKFDDKIDFKNFGDDRSNEHNSLKIIIDKAKFKTKGTTLAKINLIED